MLTCSSPQSTESHMSVSDEFKVTILLLVHKNKSQDPFNLGGAYVTTLVKQIRNHSL